MTRIAALLAAGALAALAGCGRGTTPQEVQGGDPARGHDLIVHYGCGACHRISGVSGANGQVGPSLEQLPQIQTIAGVLPNTPRNLVRWIMDAPRYVPSGDMPNLGVTRAQATDIAAYLETQ